MAVHRVQRLEIQEVNAFSLMSISYCVYCRQEYTVIYTGGLSMAMQGHLSHAAAARVRGYYGLEQEVNEMFKDMQYTV